MTVLYIFATASLALILDRLTKSVIINNLFQNQSIKIFPGVFHITLVLNKGAAFGLFKDQRIFFIILSLLIISFIIFYIWQGKKRGVSTSLALGLILAGATGNLIDRIRFGYVIDFLDFRIWPVFNIADSSITIGAIILMFKVFLVQNFPPPQKSFGGSAEAQSAKAEKRKTQN